MGRKMPWAVQPSENPRQAYVVVNDEGTPLVRQSLRTVDGRVLYLDLTPEEASILAADLERAKTDALDGPWFADRHYPRARF